MLVINSKEDFKRLLIESLIESGILKRSETATKDLAVEELIDNNTLMERLNVARSTIIEWRNKGKIRYMKVGGTYRYNWKHVLEDLERKGA
ncbi:helix-turn-helix domain-containing protein [Olivibacter sp. SDN3]|uniref:helix-turn-helix domain-containing protein n=1 Tax=Olivibacter sp. SDN3 TaxID=2764720 RepID=UPI0016519239|nr:helix-turn-helix domain-containing protein [Olivibacter sp. SDN3]QNL49239.1 helix-turn-helix domain-containing protein [Olivibacter sp. SDN3]